MTIKSFRADCGDAFRLRYLGDDNKYHNILIDSGYTRTFRLELEKDIKEIDSQNERIDLWIITHIHDDHIGGVIKYINLINDGEFVDIVDHWFYNAPRSQPNLLSKKDSKKDELMGSPISIKQGDFLYNYLANILKVTNDITNKMSSINLFGLKITILSPNQENLIKLKAKYSEETKHFEKIEDEQYSIPISRVNNDYGTRLLDFNLENYYLDSSIENKSSISIITEFNGKKILWLADTDSSDIANELISQGYSTSNKLICEWVKVSHHGSSINNNDKLYNLIECCNYLFSTNGENIYHLPHKECIANILRAGNRDMSKHYKIYFTYDNSTLRSLFEVEDENIYSILNFSVYYMGAEVPQESKI